MASVQGDGIAAFDDSGFRPAGGECGVRDGDVPGGVDAGRVHPGGLDGPAGDGDGASAAIGGDGAGAAAGSGHIHVGECSLCRPGLP